MFSNKRLLLRSSLTYANGVTGNSLKARLLSSLPVMFIFVIVEKFTPTDTKGQHRLAGIKSWRFLMPFFCLSNTFRFVISTVGEI